MPTPAIIRANQAFWVGYTSTLWDDGAAVWQALSQFAGVEPGNRVLDVGCGTSVINLALAEPRASTGSPVQRSYMADCKNRRTRGLRDRH